MGTNKHKFGFGAGVRVFFFVLAAVLTTGCGGGGAVTGGGATASPPGSSGGSGSSDNSISYVEARNPGWVVKLDHAGASFTATDNSQGTILGDRVRYSGSLAVKNNGLLELRATDSNVICLDPPCVGQPLIPPPRLVAELPGTAVINSFAGFLAVDQLACPATSANTTFLYILVGTSSDDVATQPVYGKLAAAGNGSTFDVTDNSFLIDGSISGPVTLMPGSSCQSGRLSASGLQEAISQAGPTVLRKTSQTRDAVGLRQPASTISVSELMGAQYLGVSWKPATGQKQMVGFGPGSGTSIAGGAFSDPGSEPFTNHPNNVTISITQQPEHGLLQGTLTSADGTTPFVAVASQISGKWVLFGTAQDGANRQPCNLFLLEK